MKIICIGRNYSEHAKELNNPVPEKPVIFLKPDTSLLQNNKPFYLPDFSKDIHYEAEIVLKVSKNGKHIGEKYAGRYFDELTLGIDFTARDVQSELKEKRISWELAKAFDNSAAVGKFLPANKFDLKNLDFRLEKNGDIVQQGNTSNMIFSPNAIISFVSKYISPRMGDMIFTGTPAGVGKVSIGDHLRGFVGNEKVFDFKVK